MREEHIVAAILAGGRSSRFGAPKALAVLAGAPLIAHMARAVAEAAETVVVGDAVAAAAIGALRVEDPPGAARGPLAGVLAALTWASAQRADWLMVAPCDTPLLPPDIVGRLRAAAGEGALACAETVTGLEPLISLWRVSLRAELAERLSGSAHPAVHTLMEELGAARVRLGSGEAMNVNTADDFARAEAAFAAKLS